MFEAKIVKCGVVHDSKLDTTFVAVAEYLDEGLNIKAKYDWQNLDCDGFLADLREEIAKGFDIPVYKVEIDKDSILRKMEFFSLQAMKQNALH
jgi:hypothetical protein